MGLSKMLCAIRACFLSVLVFIVNTLSADCKNEVRVQHFVSDSSDLKASLIHQFMTALYKRGQFTGSVLVGHRGKVIYKNAFGFADREKRKIFSTSTQEYIGSISKGFTAMGVMILQEEGKLLYDTPIRRIFPELPACMEPVTIRHLLHHTSGLAVFDDFPDMTEKDVFAILMKQESLRFNPGQQFEYCNSGYSLLGMVIQKISGLSLHDFLSRHIFTPLQMSQTSMNEIANRNRERATGYTMYGSENNYDTFMGGNASIISTAEDLFKWDQALYSPSFIRKETLAAAFEKSPISLEDEVYGEKSYGFGWWISSHNNSKNVFHDGAFGGYRAYLERFIGDTSTIIHISNLRHSIMLEIRTGLVNILNGKPYHLPRISAGAWMYKQIDSLGISTAVQSYHRLKKSAIAEDYSFVESELNSLGYYLLRAGRINEAIEVFVLNTKEYPASANTFDSLAEAYLKSGDTTLAITNYQRSLQLDPGNDNAVQMLRTLKAGNR